jgi:glycosyltransferase 2 family protein
MVKSRVNHNVRAKKRYWFLGFFVTVSLLYWVLKDISLLAVWKTFSRGRVEWLLVGWVAYLGVYWIRARRWGTLLSASCNPGRFNSRLAATFIGFGASSILPAYAGEFMRAAILYRLDGIPFESIIGSIFAERLLDIGVVFLLLLIPVWFGILPHNTVLEQLPIGWMGSVLILAWVMCLCSASYPVRIARIFAQLSKFLKLGRFSSRIEYSTSNFLDGLSVFRKPRTSFVALFETFCSWGLNAITFWFGLIAFGIDAPGFGGALFTQSVAALAIALPSTPGYIGPFEASIRLALGIYEVPMEARIAYAVALRFVMYITIPIIAFFIATRLGLVKGASTFPKSSLPDFKDIEDT